MQRALEQMAEILPHGVSTRRWSGQCRALMALA